VVIHLYTGNEYEQAGLTLSNPDRPKIALLRKGEPITIRCLKMMRMLGSPQGSDCTIVPAGATRNADAPASDDASTPVAASTPPEPTSTTTN
jgi:hypothetical protein